MKRKLLSAALLLSHQSCPTLCDPRDGRQPTRLPHPWDSPGKNTGVGCHFLLQCVKVKLLSHVQPLTTPWTAALARVKYPKQRILTTEEQKDKTTPFFQIRGRDGQHTHQRCSTSVVTMSDPDHAH